MAENTTKGQTPAEEEPETTTATPDVEDGKELSKKERKKLLKQIEDTEKKLKEASTALDKAKADILESSDKFMRLFAEFDNYKRRTAKESEGIYSNAYADAIKELMPVFDNIERAAEYASDEASKNGLLLIIANFREVLKKMGVEQFGAVGDEFDANIHNAVMHIEDESYGENVIAEVFQKGYKKGDKIIRYATVKVAN